MVETIVKLGPKGQFVIPKLLREEFGFVPGGNILLTEHEGGVLMQKPSDPMEILRKLQEHAKARKAKAPHPHAIYEQYEQRLRRAGVLK